MLSILPLWRWIRRGNIYLAGYTGGSLPLVNAYQTFDGGGFNEGFIAKIGGVPKPAVFVSAATNQLGPVAAGSIVSAYGVGLATETDSATTIPLPLTLGGTSIGIVDSTGAATSAALFFVSPDQINLEIPLKRCHWRRVHYHHRRQRGPPQAAPLPLPPSRPACLF